MTWNGAQGFQTPIEDESFRLANMGVYGNTHTERGLTCMSGSPWSFLLLTYYNIDVEFYFSGHMTPRSYSLQF